MLTAAKRFWNFLKEDSWKSWLVSLILTFVVIKFIFFPLLSFSLGTNLPLVVVESCSMYHSADDFDQWWEQNGAWYTSRGITRTDFEKFSFKNGLNKGDIILVSGRVKPNVGNIIIFNANYANPIIHRLVGVNALTTKGDNNAGQLAGEQGIADKDVLGTAVARVPFLGWAKLIFFEGFRPSEQRGFC